MLYVPTPKVLSTSVQWLLARAEGDPDARLPLSVRGRVPALAIHDPAVHRLPWLGALDDAERAAARTSPDWLRLGLHRDPYARLVSAWQHQVLMRGPTQRRYRAPDLAVDDAGRIDLAASFRAFVHFLDAHWDAVTADQHFAPQVRALQPDLVDYTVLAPVDELDGVLARLARHDRRLDRPLDRENEGLALATADCYDAASAEVVARRYHDDFHRLGHDPGPPVPSGEPVVLDALGTRLLAAVHERSRRLDQIRRADTVPWQVRRLGARARTWSTRRRAARRTGP